jgi:hypothetical protein
MLTWLLNDGGWIALGALWVLCVVLVLLAFAHDMTCDCCARPWAIYMRRQPHMAIDLQVCRKCARWLDQRARARVIR